MPLIYSYVLEKTIIQSGKGLENPVERSICTIRVISVDGSVEKEILEKLCGCKVNEDVEVQLGEQKGEISHIIDSICFKMKIDSKILCTITFKNDSVFMPGKRLELMLLLISINKLADSIYRLTPLTCFQCAMEFKDSGTQLFKQSRTLVAAVFYSRSIKYFMIMINSMDEGAVERETARKMLALCHTNLAACFLKFKLYPEVIANCNDALEIKDNNTKALYRRAVSFLSLNDFENAEKDISAGIKLTNNGKAFCKLFSDLKEKTAFADAQLSARLKTLFT